MTNRKRTYRLHTDYKRQIRESVEDQFGSVHLSIDDPSSRDSVYTEITSWIAANEPAGRGYTFFYQGKYLCMVSAADKNQLGFLRLLKNKGMCRWTRCSSGYFYFEENDDVTWFNIDGKIYKTTD